MSTAWRKSSYSSNGSDCVQVHRDLAAVRDSKNPGGPILRVDFRSLVTAIRDGQLDR
jgi:hypothetical protein